MNDRKMDVFWRRPYELYSGFAWLCGAIVTALYGVYGDFGFRFLFLATFPMLMFALLRFYHAHKLLRFKTGLQTQPDLHIDLEWLVREQQKNPDRYYIGHGFVWSQDHTQKLKDYLSRDESLFKVPAWYFNLMKLFGFTNSNPESHPTVCHGMAKERPIFLPVKTLYNHRGIIGSSGSGKGLYQRILIVLAIIRNEACFNMDPKTDNAIVDVAYGTMKLMGRENAFYYFSPSYPNSSVRIDLLANYTNLSQLATRIINILPPSDDPAFKNFSWRAVLAVLQAMKIQGQKPTLVKIRRAISTDFAFLVKAASIYYFRQIKVPEAQVQAFEDMPDHRECADACVQHYHQILQKEHSNRDLEQLYAFYSTDQRFMTKLIQAILPPLEMLTASPLDQLLSPDASDDDPREIITLQTVVRTRGFLYMNLAALSDPLAAQAIGALTLNDTLNVVSNRYYFEDDGGANVPLNVFVDEASDVISHAVLNMMNKSRGAYVSMSLAYQTLPDITVRLGNKESGEVLMGNMFVKTAFRLSDEASQTYMSTQFGETSIKKVDYGFVTQQTTLKDLDFNNSYSKQVSHEDVELVPMTALKDLPVAHCFTVADEIYKLRIPFIEVPDDLRYKRRAYDPEGSVNLPSLDSIATNPIGVIEFTQELKA